MVGRTSFPSPTVMQSGASKQAGIHRRTYNFFCGAGHTGAARHVRSFSPDAKHTISIIMGGTDGRTVEEARLADLLLRGVVLPRIPQRRRHIFIAHARTHAIICPYIPDKANCSMVPGTDSLRSPLRQLLTTQ